MLAKLLAMAGLAAADGQTGLASYRAAPAM